MIYAMLDGENIVGFSHSDEELPLSDAYALYPDGLDLDQHGYRVVGGKVLPKLVVELPVTMDIYELPLNSLPDHTDSLLKRLEAIEKKLAALEKGDKPNGTGVK